MDPYAVLGVPRDASDDEVRAAYKQRLRDHHPDRGGDAEQFQAVKEAYEAIQSGGAGADGGATAGTGGTGGARPEGSDPTTAAGRSRADPTTGTASGDARSVTAVFPRFERPVATAAVRRTTPDPLVAESGSFYLALLGLFEADISDLVYRHQIDEKGTPVRTVALFHLQNTGDVATTWNGWTRTEFVGSDGETYDRSDFQINPFGTGGRLPEHLDAQMADLDPGEATNGLLVVEDLPPGVRIERVRYTHAAESAEGRLRNEELTVTIRRGDRERLRRPAVPS